MPPRIPPLNALRAFEAAARLGSFKAAAAEASVAHGAMSRYIRMLEDRLGAPLFARHNRRVVLTDIGDAYHAEISPAFERLRVNALSTFTVRWLLPRLGGFRRAQPGFDVRVTTSNESRALQPSAPGLPNRAAQTERCSAARIRKCAGWSPGKQSTVCFC